VVANGGYDLPAYEKLTTLKGLGGRGTAEEHVYRYPNPITITFNCGLVGAHYAADLRIGHADDNVPALLSRRTNAKDGRLGGRRVRT
jgi:hypothetical protein